MPYRIDKIDPRTTVMIVVDMQNDFVAEGAKLQSAQAHAMVPKLAATLGFCREKGIRVIYTAHVHRRDGCDMGLYDDLYSVVADRSVLVDGSPGAEIYKDLAPAPGEHVIKKHRYSAFFATDLDLILREWGVKTVIISARRRKTAVTQRHVTPCSAIIKLRSFRMRREHLTIRTSVRAHCRRPMSIGPR
jgi:ureidoacrylate peracid hydrolase